jgi:hypothetical protein
MRGRRKLPSKTTSVISACAERMLQNATVLHLPVSRHNIFYYSIQKKNIWTTYVSGFLVLGGCSRELSVVFNPVKKRIQNYHVFRVPKFGTLGYWHFQITGESYDAVSYSAIWSKSTVQRYHVLDCWFQVVTALAQFQEPTVQTEDPRFLELDFFCVSTLALLPLEPCKSTYAWCVCGCFRNTRATCLGTGTRCAASSSSFLHHNLIFAKGKLHATPFYVGMVSPR